MNKINFSHKKFDVVLALNADLPKKNFFLDFDNIPLYASDGAGILLHRKGIMPDKVIGDLDSFYEAEESKEFPDKNILRFSDQETNDFEKCLKYCRDKTYKNILIIGFHGGQLEHTLNNWSVFRRYSKQLNLCVYDKGRYGLGLHEDFSLETKKDEIISLIPQPEAVIKTSGLKWELNSESLSLGDREGGRNIAKNDIFSIKFLSGELFVFFDHRLPFAPEYIKENKK